MSKKKGQQVVFPLATEEDFLKAIEDSSKFLTVRARLPLVPHWPHWHLALLPAPLPLPTLLLYFPTHAVPYRPSAPHTRTHTLATPSEPHVACLLPSEPTPLALLICSLF
jgi:hypothetical protein